LDALGQEEAMEDMVATAVLTTVIYSSAILLMVELLYLSTQEAAEDFFSTMSTKYHRAEESSTFKA